MCNVYKLVLPEALEPEELSALLIEYRSTHDEAIRDRLIKGNLRLVTSITRPYEIKHNLDENELIGVGTDALIHAMEGFNPDLGYKFSTYAASMIEGYLKNYARKQRTLNVPYKVKELNKEIKEYMNHIYAITGNYPTIEEISKEFKLSEEKIRSVLNIPGVMSLDMTTEGEIDRSIPLIDSVKSDSNVEEDIIDNLTISELLEWIETLSERERVIIKNYFGLDCEPKTEEKISEMLGITRAYVGMIKKDTVAKIKKKWSGKNGRNYSN